jgi:hypothetical protein
MSLLQNRFEQEFLGLLNAGENLDSYIDEIIGGKSDPYAVGERLYQHFKEKGA